MAEEPFAVSLHDVESIRVGRYFRLSEMIRSETAARAGIDNLPTEQRIIDNLRMLCSNVLDPMREALGPVHITSGYRSPEVNALIGGSGRSQHMDGEAADLSVAGRTLDDVFAWVRKNVPFDQVIREFPPGGWVHVSFSGRHRREALIAAKEAGKTVYRPATAA